MEDKLKFKEEDKQKVIDFLNFVAKKAEFKVVTAEIIDYFKLLTFMQTELLPKVNANILEIKEVIEEEKPEQSEE